MILGSLVDAGLPLAQLESELAGLELAGYRLCAEKVKRCGVAATRVSVTVSDDQPERSLADVSAVIARSRLEDSDRSAIMSVFQRLADAEAEAHGSTAESVHFHDVGALDAMIDISGALVGLRILGVSKVYASGVPLGSGQVSGVHGVLPVPAPATLALVRQNAVPTRQDPSRQSGGLSTPTGVATLSAIAAFEQPSLAIDTTGYGAGARDPEDYPNVLRVWLGDLVEDGRPGPSMLLIETNVDDMPAEQLAYAMDQLLSVGAADAWITPIQMKKGRPGHMISLLCREDLEPRLVSVIYRETSTFGMRVRRVQRHEARRESLEFMSSLGNVEVKVRHLPGQAPLVAPEYEGCRAIAEGRGLPLHEVMETIRREAEALLQSRGASSADSAEFTNQP
jgi:uncharacterized protein (TIGR00299 family) protein